MNSTTPQLALLVGAPLYREEAMHNDLIAMDQALQERKLPADRVFSLHGRLDRDLVLSFLRAARRQMDGWSEGLLFVHVSGHGFFHGDTVENARPGLCFQESQVDDGDHLFWDEFFDALDLPTGVQLILLPDL
jgi:hypothetical protein